MEFSRIYFSRRNYYCHVHASYFNIHESDKYNYRDCSLIDKQGLSLVADKLYPFKNSVLKWSFRGFIFLVETIIVMYTQAILIFMRGGFVGSFSLFLIFPDRKANYSFK